jgi:predicted nucleotidyltransferase
MTDTEILHEAVRRIREQFSPRTILLFGSRARGDAREDSDFDLLVILHDPGDWRTPGRIRGALRGLPAAFDVLVQSEAAWQEWRGVGPAFESQIQAQARELYRAAA